MDVDEKILEAQQAIDGVMVTDEPMPPSKTIRLTKLYEAIQEYLEGEK